MNDSRGHDYDIDYARVDVDDLVRQIRERVGRRGGGPPESPEAREERLRARLRAYLRISDERARKIDDEIPGGADWNVTPEDLTASHAGPLGRLISGVRRLGRPLVKILVNADLPLYKQFKLNLGLASAIRDLLRDDRELQDRLARLEDRLERLEAGREEAPREGTPGEDTSDGRR